MKKLLTTRDMHAIVVKVEIITLRKVILKMLNAIIVERRAILKNHVDEQQNKHKVMAYAEEPVKEAQVKLKFTQVKTFQFWANSQLESKHYISSNV